MTSIAIDRIRIVAGFIRIQSPVAAERGRIGGRILFFDENSIDLVGGTGTACRGKRDAKRGRTVGICFIERHDLPPLLSAIR